MESRAIIRLIYKRRSIFGARLGQGGRTTGVQVGGPIPRRRILLQKCLFAFLYL